MFGFGVLFVLVEYVGIGVGDVGVYGVVVYCCLFYVGEVWY